MNRIPTQQQVESLRKNYPVGTRVVLHSMDDPYAPVPPGTNGPVTYVDDMGQIGVNWDNGSGLSLVPCADTFSTVSEPENSTIDSGICRRMEGRAH